MDLKIYDKNGYINMPAIIKTGYPFIFIPAARGTGKTYGTLKYFINEGEKILLLRRTQKEANLQGHADSTSYKPVLDDLAIDQYYCRMTEGIGHVYINEGKEAAVCAALSTFATVRGMGYNDIKHIVYDEFIPEPHVRKIANEGMALSNLYESVDRNRQLEGRPPVQLICLANSVNMQNDVFMYFDLIRHAEQMIHDQQEVKVIGNKLLIIPQNSPISDKKAKTALYQAVNGEFAEMAIKNKFILNDFTYVQRRNLKEYRCLFQIGDIYVYEHKSEREYYVTYQKGQTKKVYPAGYAALTKLRREKWRFVEYYLDGMIKFESYNCIALFEKYFDL